MTLFVVNDSRQACKRLLNLSLLGPLSGEAGVWTLGDTRHAGERHASNSWREPDRIRPVESKATVAGEKLAYEFPPLSLTVIELVRVAPSAAKR